MKDIIGLVIGAVGVLACIFGVAFVMFGALGLFRDGVNEVAWLVALVIVAIISFNLVWFNVIDKRDWKDETK